MEFNKQPARKVDKPSCRLFLLYESRNNPAKQENILII